MLNDELNMSIFTHAIEETIYITNRNIRKWGGRLPDMADAGVYNLNDSTEISRNGSWRYGFGIGIMYLLYDYTKNKLYLDTAEKMMEVFYNRSLSEDQCQGVLHIPSCVAAYKYTSSEKAAKAAMEGAGALVRQYTSNPGYFRAYMNYENFVVDSSVNSLLMNWASNYTGDGKYYDMAVKQLDNIIKYILRPDGSTYHIYWFDDKGIALEGSTAQGHSPESCWARGQAWAMFGFALHYRITKDKRYLDTFKKLSEYYYSHLNSDMVPSWDLTFRDCGEPTDSAAAAIAVCATLEMAKQLPDDSDISGFKSKAILSLVSLTRNYATVFEDYIDALMIGGVDNIFRGNDSESLIYGDYFYLEALVRVLSDFDTFWI